MSHLETILLVAMGFALASLLAVFLLRAVWNHGERAGRRRVQRQMPTLDAELQADRTKLRAEIAMARRKAEYQVKEFRLQLAEKSSQLTIYKTRLDELSGELTERNDQIAKIRTGRVPLEAELEDRTNALHKANRMVRDLSDQIQRLKREVDAARAECRQRDRVIAELKRSRGAELPDVAEAAEDKAPAAEQVAAVQEMAAEDKAPAAAEQVSAPQDEAVEQPAAAQASAAETGGSDLEAAQARLRERLKLISELSREIAAQRENLLAAGTTASDAGDEGESPGDTKAQSDDKASSNSNTVVKLSRDQQLAADLEVAGRSAEQLRADLERLDEIWREKTSGAGMDAQADAKTDDAAETSSDDAAAETSATADQASHGDGGKAGGHHRKGSRKSAAATGGKKKGAKEDTAKTAAKGKTVERDKVVSLADKIRALQDESTQ